jgi:hypothetical protein
VFALAIGRSDTMQKESKSENTLSQQMADFKQQNPKVAEAMELFGIAFEKYQEALDALHGLNVYQSTSTANANDLKP